MRACALIATVVSTAMSCRGGSRPAAPTSAAAGAGATAAAGPAAAARGDRAACTRAPAATRSPPPGLDPDALAAWAAGELAGRARSAAVGIVDRAGLQWHVGVGARDARGGPAPDRATVYRIGSVTKLLTGAAVLQLRDAGVADLDAPVTRWVPELAALGASSPPVTLRHLVTHTSGIPSLGDGSAPYWGETPPDRAALLRALGAPLGFSPGSRSEYSNAGFALVGEIVARASGRPFRDYLQHHVLDPIGMCSAVWERSAVTPARLAIGAGAGVGAAPGTEATIDPPHWQLGAFEPAGGLYASLDDMAALAAFALGAAPHVLTPATLAEAQRDDTLPGPHGVAWIAGHLGSVRFAGHTGSTIDYSASLIAIPERGIAAVALLAGGDAALAECAAVSLARAAVEGRAPASCARPASPDAQRVAAAGVAHLRAVLAAAERGAPDAEVRAAAEAAFAPAFLAQIPAAAVVELARQIAARFGRCERHELQGSGSFGVGAVLHCQRGPLKLELVASGAAPHRIEGVVFPEL